MPKQRKFTCKLAKNVSEHEEGVEASEKNIKSFFLCPKNNWSGAQIEKHQIQFQKNKFITTVDVVLTHRKYYKNLNEQIINFIYWLKKNGLGNPLEIMDSGGKKINISL